MDTVQKKKMTVDEAIECGLSCLARQANDEESRKLLGFIAVKLMVDKEKGIRYLVSSLCANVQVMSEIIESLCGKTPQEFIKQDLEIKFEDMNLENVK